MQHKISLYFLLFFVHSVVFAQNPLDLIKSASQSNADNSLLRELKSLSTKEIQSLTLNRNGYYVLNSTTGCLNYFFEGNWFELCGNCISTVSEPSILSANVAKLGTEIFLKDSANFRAVLFPDSIPYTFNGRSIVIKRPIDFSKDNAYYLKIENLDDNCKKKKSANFQIKFFDTKDETPKTKPDFETIEVGLKLWMKNPVAIKTNNALAYVQIKDDFFYNWNLVNVDSLNKNNSAAKQIEKVCPAGWHIPNSADIENLIKYNTSATEKVADALKLNKLKPILSTREKSVEPTDNKYFFMSCSSPIPEAYHVFLFDNEEIRFAPISKEAFTRVICVED